LTAVQSLIEVLQRTQLYEYAIGCVPLQVPVVRCSLSPCSALPDRTGRAVFFGVSLLRATSALGLESADEDPAAFVAVTRMRIACPTSLAVRARVCPVAPGTRPQDAPLASHRSHWKENRIGCVPVHDPVEAARTLPSRAVPEIVGGDVLRGPGRPTTRSLASETAEPVPAEFAAVTRTRTVRRTSSASSVYACAVAPRRLEQCLPVLRHRSHWNENRMGSVPIQEPLAAVSVFPC
jgi:hypothetical protein